MKTLKIIMKSRFRVLSGGLGGNNFSCFMCNIKVRNYAKFSVAL